MAGLPPPTPPSTPTSSSTYTCPYCRTSGDATGSSCTSCGAPIDVRARVSLSGWEKQPPIRDMAHIQLGRSRLQVSGTLVPVADFHLVDGDTIYFSHHVLLWVEATVDLTNAPLAGAWNRVMGGLPLVMTQATGPGHIALSENRAGETIAVPLHAGQGVDVREHRFLAATGTVTYQWFDSNIWYVTGTGDDRETHYPAGRYLDRFWSAERPGLLLLHASGNTFLRDLREGETMLVQPGALLYKDTTVGMALHLEHAGGTGWYAGAGRMVTTPWLRLWGPGRVAVQSVFERPEKTTSINSTSQATVLDWSQYLR